MKKSLRNYLLNISPSEANLTEIQVTAIEKAVGEYLAGKVLVSRKQLEDRIQDLETRMNKLRADIKGDVWIANAIEPATFVHYLQGRKDALEKELVGGKQEEAKLK